MHFSTSSQRSKICFGYHEIIFNGEKVLKFSQIEAVRLEGDDPPLVHCCTLSLCYLGAETDDHHRNPNRNTEII